jgi:GNAT superfamily N-acetyltransferase
MYIRLANSEDLETVLRIYADARSFMKENGNPNQWGQTNPPASRTIDDISAGKLHVVCEDEKILGVFFFEFGNDPTYAAIYNGDWLNDKPYGVIHRIAISSDARGKGIAGFCFDFAYSQCNNLKIDTHKDNLPMQKSLAKNGFIKCGIIHLANGDERIAFQKTE